MVGPYAVAELRVSRALRDRGASLPTDGTHVYLTDTLESPHAKPPQLPLFLKPIADQHAKALKVKSDVPVIVCLGNPPYDRHEAVSVKGEEELTRYGGWVRFGDALPGDTKKDKKGRQRKLKSLKVRIEQRQRRAILSSFLDPATAAGHGVHVKNLYNLYVYFWRWALWKVFEHASANGPGVVSFISASSYLDGDAFCGMREHLRRQCEEVWILDLGGEGRGTRKTENVFAIQTPVAIAVAVRAKETETETPAKVHYAVVNGSRKDKLAELDRLQSVSSVKWRDCPNEWQAPFRPAGKGDYFAWPLLTEMMPWQHSGAQAKRTWPIGPDPETLKARWRGLLEAPNRSAAFKESRDRKLSQSYPALDKAEGRQAPLADLVKESPPPDITRYAYRSFDRQWILADSRVADYLRPDLWRCLGDRQVYLTSLLSHPLGSGPATTAAASVPDLHHFKGSFGAKEVVPLYRDRDASEANILPGLLELLGESYGREVTAEDFVAYVYGALAQPSFTDRYATELESRELRVPIIKDGGLFERVRDVGARLLWLHTYAERFVPPGKKRGSVPRGSARCTKAVPDHPESYPEEFEYIEETRTLRIGEGRFAPVLREVFEFEVSGLKVVQSWLKYRMKKGAGKKSSPLDDIRPERWASEFTTELLEMLWVLEATVGGYPEQASLLDAVVDGDCFQADELPTVPAELRDPPKAAKSSEGLLDFGDDS